MPEYGTQMNSDRTWFWQRWKSNVGRFFFFFKSKPHYICTVIFTRLSSGISMLRHLIILLSMKVRSLDTKIIYGENEPHMNL